MMELLKPVFLLVMTLMPLSISFAGEADLQKPQCFGDKSWPIGAIYLHGWFPPSNKGSQKYLGWERENRKKMEKLAAKLQVRIAVPVSQYVGQSKKVGAVRKWQASLGQIERASIKACEGTRFAEEGRAIIGFSDGGYKANQIADGICKKPNSKYSRFFVLGAPNSSSGCSQTVRRNEHSMPPARYFTQYLKPELTDQYGREIVSSKRQSSGRDPRQ